MTTRYDELRRRAEEILRSVGLAIWPSPDCIVAAMLRFARAEALEEAALECELIEKHYGLDDVHLHEREVAARVCASRIRALKRAPAASTNMKSPVTAEGTTGGLKEAKGVEAPCADLRQSAASSTSALSDADVLERAAEIMDRNVFGGVASSTTLRELANKLRPAPEPDVFEAFAAVAEHEYVPEQARAWFGPLVEALEDIERYAEDRSVMNVQMDGIKRVAADALAALRARAKDAGK